MIKALQQFATPLSVRYSALSRRERALVAAAVLGGALFLGNFLLIDPDLARARSAQRLVLQQTGELAAAEAQLQGLKVKLAMDPDADAKVKLAALKKQLAGIDTSLNELERGLVPPEQMTALLERLLARHASLRLLSFKSMPPVNLAEQARTNGGRVAEAEKRPESEASVAGGGLFRHGVQLKLEGSYQDLHAWLSQLENSPQKLLWGEVRFEVVDHPKSVLSVTVFTLSSDRAWLAI